MCQLQHGEPLFIISQCGIFHIFWPKLSKIGKPKILLNQNCRDILVQFGFIFGSFQIQFGSIYKTAKLGKKNV